MRQELEKRLVTLSVNIDKLCKEMPKSFMSEHLMKQIIRSSTSAALNYGEAQAAESRSDFIHKVSIVLKELRESQIALNLLSASVTDEQEKLMLDCRLECGELVAIFHKTVMTAKSKNQ
jgi:four helix bundle protein